MDTVRELAGAGRLALYGDASHGELLRQAGMAQADYLVITLPHSVNRAPLMGATGACFEEAEAAVALTQKVLGDLRGADPG
jgi:hypothetical protein